MGFLRTRRAAARDEGGPSFPEEGDDGCLRSDGEEDDGVAPHLDSQEGVDQVVEPVEPSRQLFLSGNHHEDFRLQTDVVRLRQCHDKLPVERKLETWELELKALHYFCNTFATGKEWDLFTTTYVISPLLTKGY